jgi:hypothetical protein
MDPKIDNTENQKYYTRYSKDFKVKTFKYMGYFEIALDDIESPSLIKVITSAFL